MPDYLPKKELELQAWINNFITVASPILPSLGLTTADLTPVTNDATDFGNALSDVVQNKALYESSVKTKISAMKTLDKDVRALVKRIQGHAGVSEATKTQLGINANTGSRTKTAPVTPATLTATPKATGVNIVTWNKMGNKPTTQFLVYAKPLTAPASALGDSGWTFIGQTTRSRFDHSGVTVGQPMAYRVQAARADQASAPSMPVTVYSS